MTTTLEDDLEELRQDAAYMFGPHSTQRADRLNRIARIEAALADREHLEEGARLLAGICSGAISRYRQPTSDWLEAERTRKPLSPEARASLDAGIKDARDGRVAPFGDFTKYVDDHPAHTRKANR